MVFGEEFTQAPRAFFKEDKIFDEVKQPRMFARAANHCFERDDTSLTFRVDALPFRKVFPFGGDASDAAIASIREEDERVVPKELGNGVLVIAQIVVVGILDIFLWRF